MIHLAQIHEVIETSARLSQESDRSILIIITILFLCALAVAVKYCVRAMEKLIEKSELQQVRHEAQLGGIVDQYNKTTLSLVASNERNTQALARIEPLLSLFEKNKGQLMLVLFLCSVSLSGWLVGCANVTTTHVSSDAKGNVNIESGKDVRFTDFFWSKPDGTQVKIGNYDSRSNPAAINAQNDREATNWQGISGVVGAAVEGAVKGAKVP